MNARTDRIVLHFKDGPRKGDIASFQQSNITRGRAADSDLVFDSRQERRVSGPFLKYSRNGSMSKLTYVNTSWNISV